MYDEKFPSMQSPIRLPYDIRNWVFSTLKTYCNGYYLTKWTWCVILSTQLGIFEIPHISSNSLRFMRSCRRGKREHSSLFAEGLLTSEWPNVDWASRFSGLYGRIFGRNTFGVLVIIRGFGRNTKIPPKRRNTTEQSISAEIIMFRIIKKITQNVFFRRECSFSAEVDCFGGVSVFRTNIRFRSLFGFLRPLKLVSVFRLNICFGRSLQIGPLCTVVQLELLKIVDLVD